MKLLSAMMKLALWIWSVIRVVSVAHDFGCVDSFSLLFHLEIAHTSSRLLLSFFNQLSVTGISTASILTGFVRVLYMGVCQLRREFDANAITCKSLFLDYEFSMPCHLFDLWISVSSSIFGFRISLASVPIGYVGVQDGRLSTPPRV